MQGNITVLLLGPVGLGGIPPIAKSSLALKITNPDGESKTMSDESETFNNEQILRYHPAG
jgi:hypothetical protein